MTNRLQEKIRSQIAPAIAKQFGFTNVNMVPSIKRLTINVGIRSDQKDPKVVEDYIRDLTAITGQMPVKTLAKKSISSFKIRENQVVGLMVTLRGHRMYDFLDKFLNITLPRVRDFRGLEERGFDRAGNYSIGMRDQMPFPEISADSVTHTFGLQVNISINARKPEHAKVFLKAIGLPIKEK